MADIKAGDRFEVLGGGAVANGHAKAGDVFVATGKGDSFHGYDVQGRDGAWSLDNAKWYRPIPAPADPVPVGSDWKTTRSDVDERYHVLELPDGKVRFSWTRNGEPGATAIVSLASFLACATRIPDAPEAPKPACRFRDTCSKLMGFVTCVGCDPHEAAAVCGHGVDPGACLDGCQADSAPKAAVCGRQFEHGGKRHYCWRRSGHDGVHDNGRGVSSKPAPPPPPAAAECGVEFGGYGITCTLDPGHAGGHGWRLGREPTPPPPPAPAPYRCAPGCTPAAPCWGRLSSGAVARGDLCPAWFEPPEDWGQGGGISPDLPPARTYARPELAIERNGCGGVWRVR